MTMQEEPLERSQRVAIPAGRTKLEGDLVVAPSARGLVVFAHGSGSSRLSPRNRLVAERLRKEAALGTLLFDLLSAEEEIMDAATGRLRFNIGLLAGRLVAATDWLGMHELTRDLPVGYFGASTGAAAALLAAAERSRRVSAVVSRGGRPDLAGDTLERVTTPTLLIVGGRDELVLELNRAAAERLRGDSELIVVPDATHLFEEPGALEAVASHAARWFERWLRPRRAGPTGADDPGQAMPS